jgi:hypothetical protein
MKNYKQRDFKVYTLKNLDGVVIAEGTVYELAEIAEVKVPTMRNRVRRYLHGKATAESVMIKGARTMTGVARNCKPSDEWKEMGRNRRTKEERRESLRRDVQKYNRTFG